MKADGKLLVEGKVPKTRGIRQIAQFRPMGPSAACGLVGHVTPSDGASTNNKKGKLMPKHHTTPPDPNGPTAVDVTLTPGRRPMVAVDTKSTAAFLASTTTAGTHSLTVSTASGRRAGDASPKDRARTTPRAWDLANLTANVTPISMGRIYRRARIVRILARSPLGGECA